MNSVRFFRAFVGIAGLGGLALQYGLHLARAGESPVAATVGFFSYFTIIGNCIGAAVMLSAALAPKSAFGRFSLRPGVRTAATLYLVLIGFVYHAILAAQWNPQGLALFSDQILHTLTPLAFAVDWILFTEKRELRLRMAPAWAVVPALYGAYTMARGALTGLYPYWFFEVDNLGLVRVLMNMGILIAVFAIGGAGMVFLGRALEAVRRRGN
ncbi:MAG: Pr6Pr family membrane protein [Parvularculaceae bacterium]